MKNAYRNWMSIRLRHFRDQQKWTQTQMAFHMGVSQRTYSAWEERRATPNVFRIVKLCRLLVITTDHFLEGCPDTED